MADHCPFAHPRRSYAIRLTYSFSLIPQAFWSALAAISEGVFATAHEDDKENEHVHIALWNVNLTHDHLRKRLISEIKRTIADDPPTGNALMSVKKWDGHEKYLIYMLKGDRHEVVDNSRLAPRETRVDDTQYPLLSSSYIEFLRSQWEEGNDQRRQYKMWKASKDYPQPITDVDGQKHISFTQIVEKAVAFSVQDTGGFPNAKTRFIAKDLISAYCLFNKIKMCPVYI